MGEFFDCVSSAQNKTLLEKVEQELAKKTDGSLEEFREALKDADISSFAISNAIFKTSGVKISERTVQRWRSHNKFMVLLENGESNG